MMLNTKFFSFVKDNAQLSLKEELSLKILNHNRETVIRIVRNIQNLKFSQLKPTNAVSL
jgi:hypothetical protein